MPDVVIPPLPAGFTLDAPPPPAGGMPPLPAGFSLDPGGGGQTDLPAPAQYAPLIQKAALDNNLEPAMLARLFKAESNFNPRAVGPETKYGNAQGIGQFIPATAQRFGINPFDWRQAIPASAQYVSQNRDMFGGNVGLGVAGYNWGEGNVDKWLSSGADPSRVPAETRKYVQAVTGRPIEAWVGDAASAPTTPQASEPGPREVAQARRIMPSGTPPISPQAVNGPRTQAAAAARSFQYWSRAMIAAGMLGDAGKGIVDAAKANIDLAKGFMTPTDTMKNAQAVADATGRPVGEILQNMLPDSSPEHAGAVTLAQELAKLQTLPQQKAIETNADIAKAWGTPSTAMRESQVFLRGTQEEQAALERAQAGSRPQTNVTQKVEGQGQAALVNAGIKAIEDTHAAEMTANKRTQIYGQMAEAMQGFTPGATAELRYKGEKILKDLNIISGENVPPQEIFRQAARHIQIAAQPKGQGQVSNFERQLFSEAVPNMTDSPESIAKAIDIATRLDDYDRKVAQIHRDVARENGGLPNLIEAQQRIANLGPPLSAGEINALENIRDRAKAALQGNAPQGMRAMDFNQAAEKLKANPSATNRLYFDQVYGRGAAFKVLGQ